MKKHLTNILNFLKRFFGKKKETMPNPIPTPNPLPDPGIYLSAKQVKEELRKQLAGKLSGSVKIYLPDQLYYCPDLAYTEELIENSMLDKKRWIVINFF